MDRRLSGSLTPVAFFQIPEIQSALSLVNGHVRFIWNAGQDTKVLQHPESLLPNEPMYTQRNTWYKIEISR